MKDFIQMIIIGIMIGIMSAYLVAECKASAEVADVVFAAINRLQPRYKTKQESAKKLADVFRSAGKEARIDPLLLVAISSRESSLLPGVVGSLGERGLMQVHGVALSARPEECDRSMNTISCQVRTGARWLAWVRKLCPGPTERWVSAYGRRRCPTVSVARNDRGVRIVKSRYMKIGGKNW